MQIKGSLSPRLEAVISLVRNGVVTADIGCDHAFVSIELISRGISRFAFLSDVRRGPLDSAEKNVRQYCMKNSVDMNGSFSFVLSDGLHGIENAVPKPQDIIIAGMGGELIARILSESKYSRDSDVNFILQPMTSQLELRKYLSKNGMETLRECYVKEDKKIYQMILCKYTGVIYELTEGEAEVGVQSKVDNRQLYCELIDKKTDTLKKIAANKAANGNDTDHEFMMIEELSKLKF